MLSQKLKELRRVHGLSQAALAELFEVTQQSVGRWETDQAYPSIETLKKLSNYFSVSIDYLLDNETDKTTKELSLLNIYRSLGEQGKTLFELILCQLQLIKATSSQYKDSGTTEFKIMSPSGGNNNFGGFQVNNVDKKGDFNEKRD